MRVPKGAPPFRTGPCGPHVAHLGSTGACVFLSPHSVEPSGMCKYKFDRWNGRGGISWPGNSTSGKHWSGSWKPYIMVDNIVLLGLIFAVSSITIILLLSLSLNCKFKEQSPEEGMATWYDIFPWSRWACVTWSSTQLDPGTYYIFLFSVICLPSNFSS